MISPFFILCGMVNNQANLMFKLTLINPFMRTVARARSVNSATATVAFRKGPRPRSVGVAARRSAGSTMESAGELSSNGG